MRTVTTSVVLAACTACFSTDSGDTGGGSSTEEDIRAYEDLRAELEQYRTEFLQAGAMELVGAERRLFWLTYPGWDPNLHSFDVASGDLVDCGALAGSGDAPNWRGHDDTIAWAEPYTGRYHVHDVATCAEVRTVETPPTDGSGVKWWAYDLLGTDLWTVLQEGGSHEVQSWGAGGPTSQGTLESAGLPVAELWDVGVAQDRLVVVESGRLWEVDVSSWSATWLGNESQISGPIVHDDRGVLFVGGGLFWWDRATESLTDVGQAIEQSGYVPNPTYTTSHLFAGETASVAGTKVVYHAERGIFSYDLDSGAIDPLLLDARDNSIVYRNPQVVSGVLFVESLESSSGAIGAEGRVWRVDPPLL